ncbi:uncharacterized protein PV06_09492 [Exophiala oligosperma]|uniref:FAD/NAD(P)-binding domain-containing protein n=1 Tax=Exophiala oligosperma TaxID=215243 RepID=A0A0D2AEJ2_9EURO|nr:uncharacterized protein PV06_09492 [Exophiala oligosperma]KIW38536.1 hypothetical protein PV06_09492 [Exophiala oligosperma]
MGSLAQIDPTDQKQARVLVEAWLTGFENALTGGDAKSLHDLFHEVSYFRDNGAFTWDFVQFHSRDASISTLLRTNKVIKAHDFLVSSDWPAPRFQVQQDNSLTLEAFVDFETDNGRAVAVLNCLPNIKSLKLTAMYTRLEELKNIKGPEVHPRGNGYTPSYDGETWKQHHDIRRQYIDMNPEVLIVGSGQAGLIVAAHLEQLGVCTLIVDKNERVGDNWYRRYDALHLHNPVEMNGFPFLEFPKHFPEYLPKDLMGQWLETYAQYLSLNVWTSTEFLKGSYDDGTNKWTAILKTANGVTRVLHPSHIVLATGGVGGKPVVPELPGLSSFTGRVMHSSKYTKAADYGIKKAIVVGSATSAHDIADDLYKNGVETTMIQRGSTVVVNMDTANLTYAGYIDPSISTELVDLTYGTALINPIREQRSQAYHDMATEMDKDLLTRLEAVGFHIGHGVRRMGWLDLFLRTGGGYYFNKGTSDIIAAGGIRVEQYSRVSQFLPSGLKLNDGKVIEAGLVVLATGYQNRKAEVAEQFGCEIAEKVGDIGTLQDNDGEWTNIWGQTRQRGLWFNGGGINQVRPGSKRLALLIKADLDGLITEEFRRPQTVVVNGTNLSK